MGAASLPIAHLGCPSTLRREARAKGLDVTVSEKPPIIPGPYTTDPFTCPHLVAYWIEPTGEQIAAWARDRLV
jgi:hypothetical protein